MGDGITSGQVGNGLMTGQTIIQYGNLMIYRCDATTIDQRPEMEPSGTDLKCWKFTVSGVGYIHGWPETSPSGRVSNIFGPFKGPLMEAVDATGTSVRIKNQGAAAVLRQDRYLLPPRNRFWMAVGCTQDNIDSGKLILFADPLSQVVPTPGLLTTPRAAGVDVNGNTDPQSQQTGLSLVDVADGPKCTQFDLVHAAGNNIFKIAYTFEINLSICNAFDQSTNATGVLSHRWSCTDEIDTNLQTRRHYAGLLEVATAQFSPHWFRYLVVPPIQQGFRRDHMTFAATADGKKLQYTIVDSAVAYSAPPPATRWQVEHHEILTQNASWMSNSTCSVTLEGPPNVDKGQLITLGLYIVTAKLIGIKPGDPQNGRQVRMGDLHIADWTGDVNRVMVSATANRLLATIDRVGAVKAGDGAIDQVVIPNVGGFQKEISAQDFSNLAFAAGYDKKRSVNGYPGQNPPYQGPEALTTIFRSILNDPCNFNFDLAGDTQSALGTNMLMTDFNGYTQPNRSDAPTYTATVVSQIANQASQNNPTAVYSSSGVTNPYTHYQCETKIKRKTLRAAMPIAKPISMYNGVPLPDTTVSTSFVTLGPIQATLELRIRADRLGADPELPDPERVGAQSMLDQQLATTTQVGNPITMVCLESSLLPRTNELTANGQMTHHAGFEALYALDRCPGPNDSIKIGHTPFLPGGQLTITTPTLTGSSWT